MLRDNGVPQKVKKLQPWYFLISHFLSDNLERIFIRGSLKGEGANLKKRGISLGVIAVPAKAAQEVADKLVKAGICGILNFAPYHLRVPKRVKVITIDIAMDLARLPYYLPVSA